MATNQQSGGLVTTIRNRSSQPQGTLQSQGLYFNPNVPQGGSSAGGGLRGADNRAYTRDVQGNELVSEQLTGLLDRGGRYIENAQRRGLEQANRRGLLNSSIAAGSAERAAIEAGMPIAAADAQAYGRAASENLGFLNQNLMQERDIANRMLGQERDLEMQSALQRAALGSQERINEANIAGALRRQRENLAYLGEQSGLDRAQQMNMLGAEYAFRNQFADNEVFRNEWMNNQNFGREMYGALAGAQIGSTLQFNNMLAQAMFNDPQVFGNPEFLSGINNFFRDEVFAGNFDRLFGDLLFNNFGGG